jgi:hypothetical protein
LEQEQQSKRELQMAYYNQEMKRAAAPQIRALLNKYGMKGSLSVHNHSTVVLTLSAGPIDFDGEYQQVNVYWIAEHYTGVAREFLLEAYRILMVGNHNNSDVQTDYFDVGWYVDIHVGRWDRPYVLNKMPEMA